MMKITEFKARLALYGADLSRWPGQEIRPAVDLIQNSPEAEKIFLAAETLDQLLRQYQPAKTNMNRLAEIILKRSQAVPAVPEAPFARPAYFYIPGGGLLMAAVLGFMIGFHPAAKEDLLIDPASYAQEQVDNDTLPDFYNGGAS